MWKLKWKMNKEKWLALMAVGAALLILAMPADGGWPGSPAGADETGDFRGADGFGETVDGSGRTGAASVFASGAADDAGNASGTAPAVSSGANRADTVLAEASAYETELERRVKEILNGVDGVGEVDVMIVLKSSEEKILHLDRTSHSSSTEEKDSAGGGPPTTESENQESAVMAGGSGGAGSGEPIVLRELYPEISGIVISAAGGGNPKVQAEITAAMEALFGLPSHKIKVLKRAEQS